MMPTIARGRAQGKILASEPGAGISSMGPRSLVFAPPAKPSSHLIMPGTCPAPTTARTFFSEVSKTRVARYWSRSSMSTVLTEGRESCELFHHSFKLAFFLEILDLLGSEFFRRNNRRNHSREHLVLSPKNRSSPKPVSEWSEFPGRRGRKVSRDFQRS